MRYLMSLIDLALFLRCNDTAFIANGKQMSFFLFLAVILSGQKVGVIRKSAIFAYPIKTL